MGVLGDGTQCPGSVRGEDIYIPVIYGCEVFDYAWFGRHNRVREDFERLSPQFVYFRFIAECAYKIYLAESFQCVPSSV